MIRFLHLRRRESPVAASALGSPLERVRDLRGHSDWEPLTNPSNIRERADRVAEARQRIEIPPLAHQRETTEAESRFFHTAEFWRPMLYTIAGFSILVLAAYVSDLKFSTHPEVRQASVVLPSSGITNLTESRAEGFARLALESAGLERHDWIKLACYTNEDAIVVTFRHWDERFTILRVTVKLEPDSRIVCTVNPQ